MSFGFDEFDEFSYAYHGLREREYDGKIVAIEIEKGKIAGVGDGLEEAWKHAHEK